MKRMRAKHREEIRRDRANMRLMVGLWIAIGLVIITLLGMMIKTMMTSYSGIG